MDQIVTIIVAQQSQRTEVLGDPHFLHQHVERMLGPAADDLAEMRRAKFRLCRSERQVALS